MIKSLGRVLVAAAGTPVAATSNFTAGTPETVRVPTQSIMFQALPANAGVVYIGLKGFTKSGVGLTGELAILPKPVSASTGPFTSASFSIPLAPAGLNANDLYVDADTNGDGVLVTVVTQ
jgi:hypothetical protein